jgi:hypothetical protein
MRKYSQRIVLVEKADTLNQVPMKAGNVTLQKLTHEDRVEKIIYTTSGLKLHCFRKAVAAVFDRWEMS